MYKIISTIPAVLFLFSFAALSSETKAKSTSRSPPSTPSWKIQMRVMADTLTNLVTELSLDENKSRKARVMKLANSLAQSSQNVDSMLSKHLQSSGDEDPSLELISDLFRSQVVRAKSALDRGQWTYALALLSEMPGYCLSCHTRTKSGTQTMFQLEQSKSLPALARARLYASTRQFRDAYNVALAESSNAPASVQDRRVWNELIRLGTAVAVRVDQDPKKAEKIVGKAQQAKNLRKDERQVFIDWKKSILKWKNEKKLRLKKAKDYLAVADSLIQKGRKKQRYPADHRAYVKYLRASSVLHEMLSKFPGSPFVPEAYYELGLVYERLKSFNLWVLHESYYERCIRSANSKKLAKKCYERLKASIEQGFTGSSGTSLPPDIKEYLKQLKTL